MALVVQGYKLQVELVALVAQVVRSGAVITVAVAVAAINTRRLALATQVVREAEVEVRPLHLPLLLALCTPEAVVVVPMAVPLVPVRLEALGSSS